MSTIQTKILSDYQKMFPNETLKQTSEKTKIQQTRIFRIFHGSEMKVSELEKFQSILIQKESKLQQLSFQCTRILTKNQIGKLIEQIEYQLHKAHLFPPIDHHQYSQNIA